jgi:hypothetical protein
MRAGVEEVAEMLRGIRDRTRIGDTDTIESERARLMAERRFEGRRQDVKVGEAAASPLPRGEVGTRSVTGEGLPPNDRS